MATKMIDIPMSDADREFLRNEFDGFDDMTLDEYRKATQDRVDKLYDLVHSINEDTQFDTTQ